MKKRPSEWIKYVKLHVDNGIPMTTIAKKYHLELARLKYKIKLYLMHGMTPFTDDQEKRVYTREEKLEAIQTVLKGEKSGRQLALELAIPHPNTINDWAHLYQ